MLTTRQMNAIKIGISLFCDALFIAFAYLIINVILGTATDIAIAATGRYFFFTIPLVMVQVLLWTPVVLHVSTNVMRFLPPVWRQYITNRD